MSRKQSFDGGSGGGRDRCGCVVYLRRRIYCLVSEGGRKTLPSCRTCSTGALHQTDAVNVQGSENSKRTRGGIHVPEGRHLTDAVVELKNIEEG